MVTSDMVVFVSVLGVVLRAGVFTGEIDGEVPKVETEVLSSCGINESERRGVFAVAVASVMILISTKSSLSPASRTSSNSFSSREIGRCFLSSQVVSLMIAYISAERDGRI